MVQACTIFVIFHAALQNSALISYFQPSLVCVQYGTRVPRGRRGIDVPARVLDLASIVRVVAAARRRRGGAGYDRRAGGAAARAAVEAGGDDR